MAAGPETRCTNCGAKLAAAAKICVNCGTHVGTGLNVKTIAKARTAGKFGHGLAIAAATAITGGWLWALVAKSIEMEIGWLAIGLGFINALVLVAVSGETSARVGLAACVLALVSLLVGKVLMMHHFVDNRLVTEFTADSDNMEDFLAWRLFEQRKLSPASMAAMTKYQIDDEEDLPAAVRAEVAPLWANLSEQEQTAMAEELVDRVLAAQGMTFSKRLMLMLSFADVLWVVFAVMAAYRTGSGTGSQS